MGSALRFRVLSPLGLGVTAAYIAVLGVSGYLEFHLDPPQGPTLSGLAILFLIASLLLAGGLIAVGVFTYRRNRPALATGVLIWISILVLVTYELDVFPVTTDTQNDWALRLVVATVPAVVTWAWLRSKHPSSA